MESIKKWNEKEALDGLSEDKKILKIKGKDEYGRVVEMKYIM